MYNDNAYVKFSYDEKKKKETNVNTKEQRNRGSLS